MKHWLVGFLLGLVATLIHLGVMLTSFGDRLELKSFDFWTLLRGSKAPPEDVVIIAMNEASYQNLDIPLNQAWPRAVHAKLLQRLSKADVRGVIFDVLFVDPGLDKKVDQTLASAIGSLPVVLGADSLIRDYSSGSGSFKMEEVLLPYDPFKEKAKTVGLVGFPEDSGSVRRFMTERTSQTRDMPTLSEAAANLSTTLTEKPGDRDLINFFGPAGTIPFAHYYQVIDKEHPIPLEALKGKTIFVGLVLQTDVGPSQKDVFVTPFGKVFGTEIHATAVLNLIYKNWINRASAGTELGILSLVSLIVCSAIFALRPLWGIAIVGGLFVSWFFLGYIFLGNNLFIPGFVLTTIIAPFCLLCSVIYYYFVTRKAELKMLSAFELYVSPQMAKEVTQSQKSLSLGGEKVWATAMFTDIQGFTSLAETMPAEQVSAMLNAYFTEVMDVVFKNDGTLLKFIGDAIFVIWGAPVRINNHAEKACQTALAIQREVKRFNNSKRFPPLITRIGIHTGPMVVGNLGSAKRFDYTAIGDSVNLASRVEGVNKYFGTSIIITDDTKKELAQVASLAHLGSIKAAGKDEAVKLYTLLEQEMSGDILNNWNSALEDFKHRNWSGAKDKFRSISQQESVLRKTAEFYLIQIQKLESTPPPAAWQGEVSLSDK
jgi:adenylate cyclase